MHASDNQPQHGGNLAQVARRYGVAPDSLIDFSASINPLGLPAVVEQVLSASAPLLLHYPDPDCTELTHALAERHGVAPRQIIVGNGSNALIYLLCRVLKPKRAVIVEPTFSEYAAALGSVGCEIDRVFAKPEQAFQHPLDEAARAAQGADVLFVCNPNNPTAAMASREALLDLAAARPNCTVVFDEAFMDFVEDGDANISCLGRDHVLVLRSMTKFYAIPGLRLGYAVGPEDLIAQLHAAHEPWTVNALAQAVGVAMLGERKYAQRTRELVKCEREWLTARLREIPGLQPCPAHANYLLMRLPPLSTTCDALRAALIPRGIVIRHCSNFPGLGPEYFRVAVRTRHENQKLVAAIRQALADLT